jgi:hypothetical protein
MMPKIVEAIIDIPKAEKAEDDKTIVYQIDLPPLKWTLS